jgi:hypothetical protein
VARDDHAAVVEDGLDRVDLVGQVIYRLGVGKDRGDADPVEVHVVHAEAGGLGLGI